MTNENDLTIVKDEEEEEEEEVLGLLWHDPPAKTRKSEYVLPSDAAQSELYELL